MSSDERSPKDSPREKNEGRSPSKDITPVLRGWDYEPGTINVRKVSGIDGSPKLQMRQDLGLLQMEITGRPDGRRPHGYESLLEYFETQLADHRRRNQGSEDGFHLSRNQCQSLRDEAMMYYWRVPEPVRAGGLHRRRPRHRPQPPRARPLRQVRRSTSRTSSCSSSTARTSS